MIDARAVTGAALAGGRSERMGRDKALLSTGGVTFLQRVTRTLGQVFSDVAIISSRDGKQHLPGTPVLRDLIPGCGPLGGIHTALSTVPSAYVFVLSCDVPLVSAALLREILEGAQPGGVTVAGDGINIHPLVGLYPVALRPLVEEDLRSGRRRVGAFLARPDVRLTVLPLSHRSHELRTMNTPEDLSASSTDADGLQWPGL